MQTPLIFSPVDHVKLTMICLVVILCLIMDYVVRRDFWKNWQKQKSLKYIFVWYLFLSITGAIVSSLCGLVGGIIWVIALIVFAWKPWKK
jgi:uncharacterized membrane protein YfcA